MMMSRSSELTHRLFHRHKPIWRDVPMAERLVWRVCTVCQPRYAETSHDVAMRALVPFYVGHERRVAELVAKNRPPVEIRPAWEGRDGTSHNG